MVAINQVMQFPPIESQSIIVIIEFQYGTWTDSPFFALLFSATMTWTKLKRETLINLASYRVFPSIPDFPAHSDPDKSTN